MFSHIILEYLVLEDFFIVNFFISYQNYCFFNEFLGVFPEFLLLCFILQGLVNFYCDKTYGTFQVYIWIFYLTCLLLSLIITPDRGAVLLFGFSFINCWYTKISKIIIIFLTILVLCISKIKLRFGTKLSCPLEFPVVVGFSILFLFFLTSTYDFLGFYLSIEGLSLTLYVLSGMLYRSLISIESAVKYFSLGAISTGVSLFGISLLYGLVGSLDFLEVQLFLSSGSLNFIAVLELKIALSFLFFGLFFKISAFPCHWWVADVYEGVWTPITAYFLAVVKVGILLFFFRLVYNVLFNVLFLFQHIFIIVALGSLLVGTFGALRQTRVKRFIAYTSISQVGSILFGISSVSLGGLISSLLYLFVYTLTSIGFFILILNTEHVKTKKNIIYLNELHYLSTYSPKFARYLTVIFFSMSGIPPLGGFITKLFIYSAAIDARLDLVVFISLLISVVSTYYYLNFISYVWFEKLNAKKLYTFNIDLISNFILISIIIFLIVFFIILPNFILPGITGIAISCIWPFFFF